MDEFSLLARDLGIRSQGKSAPMAASRSSSNSSWNKSRSGFDPPPPAESRDPPSYGGAFDSIFDGINDSAPKSKSTSTLPVHDKPVYDDDIFDGVPGTRSSSIRFDDVFASMSAGSGSGSNHAASPPYDDLLENLGKAMPESKRSEERKEDLSGFDELIPGFGGSSPPNLKREAPTTNPQKPAIPSAKPTASMSDPFVVLETSSTSAYSSPSLFLDPFENLSRPMNSESTKVDSSSATGRVFEDSDPFDRLSKSVPLFTAEANGKQSDTSSLNDIGDTNNLHHFTRKEAGQQSSFDGFEDIMPQVQPAKSSEFDKSVDNTGFHNSETYSRNSTDGQSPKADVYVERADDAWVTITEIPLLTQPTTAPPPSRPPPPPVSKQAQFGANAKRRDAEYFPQPSDAYGYSKDSMEKSGVSPIDELENFAMGKSAFTNNHTETFTVEEELDKNSAAAASAAAMKEAMDRAEAKFKHAKEVRERKRDTKLGRSRDPAQREGDEKVKSYVQNVEDKERDERLEEQKEEQKRLEKERELEIEKEREKARQAVERAVREARERAAAEARLVAEREARQRSERAAVQRAAAEARDRAAAEARERAAKAVAEARERAAAEVRERAASEAKERAAADARDRAAAEARERAAAETREKTAAEARAKAERAAVQRAAAEARQRAERAAVERAAAEARERHAAAAREKQQKADNDLESFFGMGSRANSAPKQRAAPSETGFDAQAQGRGGSDGRRTASSSAATVRKTSTTNIVDDLSSIFGAAPSSGQFQEMEGESEERRRARLERHQRTLERAAKALAEKNERDMQTQKEQAERHRIGETLDFEVKRWAAGKEGNLRALLSTLQYILWPECGWQPISLTDLITAAAVKKVYRKATLCIHPDKVQQKGANLQQKYIAEKVFDLLKEAWNKFNSEELF
ncbi:auxilin-related protein 1-like [Typha latifolia]|uniref:auxilin-related protein 1-like n=1 Tax=Typha latifolia TaxID=4733 RepID=UPI003C2B4C15